MLLPAAVEKSELKATVLHLWFGEYRDCFFRTIVAARYLQEQGLSAKIALGGTVIAQSSSRASYSGVMVNVIPGAVE